MGKRNGQAETPPLTIGPTAPKFVAPDGAFWLVHNFLPTDQGGYISVHGPLPVIRPEQVIDYGNTHGIFHARLMSGERDVLLLHSDNQIWELSGWSRTWRIIVGPANVAPVYTDVIPTPAPSDYPTQWVATPTGIVIVPSYGRSYFYDGIKCLPLGYDKTPGPPIALGPENTASTFFPDPNFPLFGVNDSGYSVDGLLNNTQSIRAMDPYFRYGRIGTITTPGNMPAITEDDVTNTIGYLESGRWRGRVQWIDCWGNLSPLSPPSNDIKVTRQPSEGLFGPEIITGAYFPFFVHAELVRKQFGWDGLSKGPTGTIGRNLFRTKDMLNSGDVGYYEVPRDATVNAQAFATLPDNISSFYPDNIPDAWLINPAIDIAPVPTFRLAVMAFGRLFIANFRGDPGAMMWSMPGRWGTFEKVSKMYPDPAAAAITGMHLIDGGLIVFTETSVFLVTPNAEGDGFRSSTLSTNIGCIAPSTIATLRNGSTVWLGRDGFYSYTRGEMAFLWDQLGWHAKRFNRGSLHKSVAAVDPKTGQYRCWLPYESSDDNNMCFTYDGSAWHTRDETSATGVTATADHRGLLITTGDFDGDTGVWVIDRGGVVQTTELLTAWFRNMRSKDRASVRFVWLWLRETGSYTDTGSIKVDVYRDYRAEIVSTSYTLAYPVEGTDGPAEPDFWDVATFGTTAKWRHRRPFWVRVDIDVPACETFQLKVSCLNETEIIAVSFDEMPRDTAGASAYGV